MAEVIAALSLASNILQFIDFGSKLVARFYDFYTASRGAEDVPDIELLTEDLYAIAQQLEIEDVDQSESSKRFRDLAKGCNTLATELLEVFKSLIKKKDNESRASSIKIAFKAIWKQEDISRLQHRLEQYRSQLVLHIVSESREQIRKSETYQRQVLQRIEQKVDKVGGTQYNVSPLSDSFGSRIVDMIVSKLAAFDRLEQKRSLESALIVTLLANDKPIENKSVARPAISKVQYSKLSKRILGRLHYSNMDDREESIIDAHAQTFRWIFDKENPHHQEWSSLPDWLESDHQIYWVTGKAGSGKSTLMKYIRQSQNTWSELTQGEARCVKYLRSWAPEPLNLVLATYFFWNSGTELQMSQSGLMRSLLYQLLSQLPDLIPLVMPGRWDALCLFDYDSSAPWTEQELKRILSLAIRNLEEDVRLCLLVDGLDEFDGDHKMLVQLFKGLVENPNVKLCVSSRPWEIFETAFNQNPSLRMEVLTYDDIKAYTSAELSSNADFALLQKREREYADCLVENIVEKATGVFLWVRLVVTSLMSGMIHGDRVIDLQRRLDMLPPELERLYDKILQNLDPFYFEHAAQLFRIVETVSIPMSTLMLSFIDEEDYNSAINRKLQPLTDEDRDLRNEMTTRRINSRTKGLLEVSRIHRTNTSSPPYGNDTYSEPIVQYLHRTVHDYITSAKVQSTLHTALKQPFDAHTSICIGLMAYMKTKQPSSSLMIENSSFWNEATQFMRSAALVRRQNYNQVVEVMDAFNRTAERLAQLMPRNRIIESKRPFCEVGQWIRLHSDYQHPSFGCHFQSLAVVYGITYYIKARATESCFVQKLVGTSGQFNTVLHPLFKDAVFHEIRQKTRPGIEMMDFLLQIGARFLLNQTTALEAYDPVFDIANYMDENLSTIRVKTKLEGWSLIIKFLIEHHNTIWSAAKVRSLPPIYRSMYQAAIRRRTIQLKPTYASQAGNTIFGSFDFLSNLRDAHGDRLNLLQAIKARIDQRMDNLLG